MVTHQVIKQWVPSICLVLPLPSTPKIILIKAGLGLPFDFRISFMKPDPWIWFSDFKSCLLVFLEAGLYSILYVRFSDYWRLEYVFHRCVF
jgi:hypothetical protein